MMRLLCTLWCLALLYLNVSVKAQHSCANGFPVKVKGTELVLNDGTDRRFFLSGMVDNRPSSGEQLTRYDRNEMEQQMIESIAIGCNAMRWNAFLKGLDFTWDENGFVSGLKPGSFTALKDGLDLAYDYGIMMQVVLSTAHFLKYGWGGADHTLGGIKNSDRVANFGKMFSTEQGTQAYLDNVLSPLCDSLGQHPALLGYVVINEAYGMTDPQDTPNGAWADEPARLVHLQRWVNRSIGLIHKKQPGAICTVSGISAVRDHYEDDLLLTAGGDSLGLMDIYQYQYYPENHKDDYSPFQATPGQLAARYGGASKPVIVGEFPIEGIAGTPNNSVPMTPQQAYQFLWDNGYSGGFTWSNLVYTGLDASEKQLVDAGYLNLYDNYLKNLDPWEFWEPDTDCNDCNGDLNGTAEWDNCGVCSGGNTGLQPNSSCSALEITLEAEDANLIGVIEESNYSGFTGSGYVGNFKNDGDALSFDVAVPQSGEYELYITYHSPFAKKKLNFNVNNGASSSLPFEQTSGFEKVLFTTITLLEGNNTLNLMKDMSWVYIDNIVLVSKDIVTSSEEEHGYKKQGFFPNPTTGLVSLVEADEWTLLSSEGLVLENGWGLSIDLSKYTNGTYLIRLKENLYPVIKN